MCGSWDGCLGAGFFMAEKKNSMPRIPGKKALNKGFRFPLSLEFSW